MLEIMVVQPNKTGVRPFSAQQAGQLFTFLARQMARHARIRVDRRMFEQVLGYLTSTEDTSQHEERQQASVPLWACCTCLPPSPFIY